MFDQWIADLLSVLAGWLPPETLGALEAHGRWVMLALALAGALAGTALVWGFWLRLRRTAGSLGRAADLLRTGSGRRALRLAGELRRGCRRLRRVIGRTLEDRAERRALEETLEQFVRRDLETALDRMRSWAAIGGAIRVRELERVVTEDTQRWSALTDAAHRQELEQSLARKKQQLALARRTVEDRERMLAGLDEALAAIRTLEAELVALGEARSQSLPGFREQLGELSQDLRHQRDVHLEYPARPG